MDKSLKENKVVLIREAECIGCTKCIEVCPFDSIVGAAKHMHTVIADECIGCELCIPACPVDCIDLINLAPVTQDLYKEKIDKVRERYHARKKRLNAVSTDTHQPTSLEARKAYIQAAIQRTQTKK